MRNQVNFPGVLYIYAVKRNPGISFRLLLTVFFIISFFRLFAQQYAYTQYTIRDGLAGSTVYGINQDSKGFMWFATETGVSRFDGVHFKNFTTADGLPGNEFLGVYPDTQGRIWIASFSKNICYYKDGKIFNSSNDPLLKKIKQDYLVEQVSEDDENNIVIRTSRNYIVIRGNEVSYYPASYPVASKKYGYLQCAVTAGKKVEEFRGYVSADMLQELNNFFPAKQYSILAPSEYSADPAYMAFNADSGFIFSADKKEIPLYAKKWIDFRILNDSLVALKDKNSFTIYNIKTGLVAEKFVLSCIVNEIFLDREGEYWFSTKGQGVYKLISPRFESYKCLSDGISFPAINIQERDNMIYVSDDYGSLWKYDPQQKTFDKREHAGTNVFFSDNILLNPFQQFKDVKAPPPDNRKVNYTIKSIIKYGDVLLAATSGGVYLFNPKERRMTDSLWGQRTTCAIRHEGAYYTGTLNGLYKIDDQKNAAYLGTLSRGLDARISFMAVSANGILWVATYGYGVTGIRHDSVVASINGLRDKLCLSLFIHNNAMWVGTNKGIYKVELSSGKYNIAAHYSMYDGLSSDIINCIYVKDDRIYAGTPMGLTVFREGNDSNISLSRLYINGITVSGRPVDPEEKNLLLSAKDNNISFDFAGISFLSGGMMQYRYKLTGLDTGWKTTNESSLQYPSLPPGKYELQIIAVNRFGIQSDTARFSFSVRPPYWQLWWVKLMMLGLVATIVAFIISERNAYLRKKAIERMRTEKRMTELEQMALRAQMNPHFIFNCLNSIQGYIIRQDIKGSNAFLARFAALIRQTLENSPKLSISLSEEIEYLENYIELERVQMNGGFEFEIRNSIEQEDMKTMIPNMVVQPYVENAIKHGMKNTAGKTPRLVITFTKTENMFTCTVEDNGGGIDSEKNKSNTGHISRGMSITDRRVGLINLLNKNTKQKMTVEVKDLSRLNPGETGTRVILKFPLNKN